MQATDAATRVTVALDKVPTGAGVYASVIGRGVTGQGDYRAKVTFRANGAVAVALFRQAADGTQTVLGTESVVPGLTYVAGQKIAVALEVTGYERGTITPLGSSTAWPVVADSRIVGRRVALGAGAHGFSAFVEADDLVAAYDATVADVSD